MHIVARLREIINPKDEQQITDFFKAVEEFEVRLLTDALRRGRTKTESARLLSLNRTTFLAKLKTRGIV
jgi:transcriptional regulator with PAS, ATPase and Fis domain